MPIPADSWLIDPDDDSYASGLSDALNEDAPDLDHSLFHYTTEAGLDGILRTGDLWATSLAHMDDPSEAQLGAKLSSEVSANWSGRSHDFDRIARGISPWVANEANRERFIVSFCSKPDYLLAWRAYAADSAGYCLEFASAALKGRAGWYMAKIEYREEEQRNEIRRILARVEQAYMSVARTPHIQFLTERSAVSAAMWLSLVAPSFKALQYESEQEWRLIQARLANDESPPPVRQRLRGGEAVPYVALSMTATEFTQPPILRILCGARVSDATVKDVSRLATERFPECVVEKSKLEFRRRGR